MSRCTHGFELTVIDCPVGCGGPSSGGKPLKSGPRATSRQAHPGFINIVGRVLAGVRVVERAPNATDGSARWTVEFPCGHRVVHYTSRLRRAENMGYRLRCTACRAERRAS